MTNTTTEIPLEGTLAEHGVTEILPVLEAARFTGALRVGHDGGVWFHDGRTYLAMLDSSPELADVLYSARVGPVAEIAMSLRESSDVATSLVQQNPESEAMLRRVLREYTLNALFEMTVPSELPFGIVSDEVHPLGYRFSDSTTDLLSRTTIRIGIWQSIAARIPNTDMVFNLSPELPEGKQDRSFAADEWRYVSLLDGRNSVADLINQTGESAFSVCSGLYRLLLEGLVVE